MRHADDVVRWQGVRGRWVAVEWWTEAAEMGIGDLGLVRLLEIFGLAPTEGKAAALFSQNKDRGKAKTEAALRSSICF